MTTYTGDVKYVPGTYATMRPQASDLADRYIREWEKSRLESKEDERQAKILPAVCFSRKIGVGALEIADLLAEKIGYKVVDREILEHIANKADLEERTVAVFDERYPGEVGEFLSMAFGKKSFIKSDYSKLLFSTVFSIYGLSPTIFVGRGAHLLLPRDRVLAVRFLSSEEYRAKRLAGILEIEEKEAGVRIAQIDKEQADFFKKVYGKKDASPYEFDMVVNCDYIKEPEWAAEIVAKAFERKFGAKTANELRNK